MLMGDQDCVRSTDLVPGKLRRYVRAAVDKKCRATLKEECGPAPFFSPETHLTAYVALATELRKTPGSTSTEE
jgi:hypothetical protein